MKKLIFGYCLGFCALVVPSTSWAADTYKLDNAHTGAIFSVGHLGFSHTWGRFKEVAGNFVIDAVDPSKSAVEIVIQADSIDTNDAKRDKHLKTPDFFNAKQNPTLSFHSSSVKKSGDKDFEVAGNITINGVTKPLTLTITKVGEGKDPWGNQRMGFETQFVIKRSDFKMTFMPEGVSDEVTIYFSAEGIKS